MQTKRQAKSKRASIMKFEKVETTALFFEIYLKASVDLTMCAPIKRWTSSYANKIIALSIVLPLLSTKRERLGECLSVKIAAFYFVLAVSVFISFSFETIAIKYIISHHLPFHLGQKKENKTKGRRKLSIRFICLQTLWWNVLVSNCFPDPDICSIAIKAKKSGINYFYIYKLLTIFSEIKPRTFIYLKLQKFCWIENKLEFWKCHVYDISSSVVHLSTFSRVLPFNVLIIPS